MIKVSYDMPGAGDTREFDTEVVLVSWESPKEACPILSPVSMLASVRNIGPCFGLFINPDGTKKLPIRVAGTLITSWEPENPAVLIFECRNTKYRVMINFFKIRKLNESRHQCDFVITGIRPHNDTANIFNFGMGGDSINLESLKDLLSFDLTVQEEAVFNAEGGFTLREIDKPKDKKKKKVDNEVARLDSPVVLATPILDKWRARDGSQHKNYSEVREAFLKAWTKANLRDNFRRHDD